jgi:hypothetical protein
MWLRNVGMNLLVLNRSFHGNSEGERLLDVLGLFAEEVFIKVVLKIS